MLKKAGRSGGKETSRLHYPEAVLAHLGLAPLVWLLGTGLQRPPPKCSQTWHVRTLLLYFPYSRCWHVPERVCACVQIRT